MTAPAGSIVFNNSTGSDTAASGLGPATAISGTGASLNATATVTLSADTPDLSGVSAGDLLWVDTSSGRKFSIIASVDDGADTVTCDDAFSVTESGKNWGIGGKRSSLVTSAQLFTDLKAGWTIDIEYTGTDYTAASGTTLLTVGTSGDQSTGFVHITSSSGTQPTLKADGNASCINLNAKSYIKVSNLSLVLTGSSGGYCIVNNNSSAWAGIIVENCTMTCSSKTGAGSACVFSANTFDAILIHGCTIYNMNTYGIQAGDNGGGNDKLVIANCDIYGNSINIDIYRTTYQIQNCIISGASGDGVAINAAGSNRCAAGTIQGCVFYGNGSDGLYIGDLYNLTNMRIYGNIFYGNTGYGINLASAPAGVQYIADYNGFGSNTAGNRSNIAAGSNDITLTADPFVNSGSRDFNINDTSGGGTSLRAATVTI